jgi:RNA polymerase sigma-70 factor (sigma-E family)
VRFDAYVDERLAALLRYATAITCDPHLAEDVVQETLVRAQSRWDHIGQMSHPDAYVRRMVLNEFVSWRRRLSGRTLPVRHETIDAVSPAVADHAAGVVERDAMVAMIAALPPRQRAVLALRFYQGSTDAEIAQLLGCSEATVRSHASRALATLRAGSADRGQPRKEKASR